MGMGFLKKVFGKDVSLEDITDPNVVKRAPRVKIIPLHEIHFESNEGEKILLSNFSTSGVGFIKESLKKWPLDGTVVEGNFVQKDKKYPAALKVVHQSGMVVGCSFEGEKLDIENLVNRTFDLEFNALKLVKVRDDLLKEEPVGKGHWFLGGEASELYFVEEQGTILHFHMAFLGHYVEFNKGEGTRFGEVVEEDREGKPSHKSSSLVRYHSPVPPELVQNTVRFLENISDLSEDYRNGICTVLKS